MRERERERTHWLEQRNNLRGQFFFQEATIRSTAPKLLFNVCWLKNRLSVIPVCIDGRSLPKVIMIFLVKHTTYSIMFSIQSSLSEVLPKKRWRLRLFNIILDTECFITKTYIIKFGILFQ